VSRESERSPRPVLQYEEWDLRLESLRFVSERADKMTSRHSNDIQVNVWALVIDRLD
jgi:hypothetical protein